jgi:hypothetical protein
MDLSFLTEGQGRWLLLGLVLAVPVVWALWRGQRPPRVTGSVRNLDSTDTVIGWPPEPTRLLTHRQRRAMEVLRRAMPEYMVFAQVPLSRFIRVPTRASYAEWLRRIGHVCVDLLVCDRASSVVAVVEVRESGRSPTERARKRQQRLERVLRAAGVPYQVWDEAWLPDALAVRKTLVPDIDDLADRGASTLPMEIPSPLFGHVAGEPPRSTWFDEVHGSRPAPLEAQDSLPAAPGYRAGPNDPALQQR